MSDSTKSTAFSRGLARIAVRSRERAQEERKATMNQIRDLVRKKNEDISFDEVEDEKDPDERDYDAKYQDDNLPDLIEEMQEDGTLEPHEYSAVQVLLEAGAIAEEIEERYQEVMKLSQREPIYTEWLENVYGVSHTLTAKLIHKFGYCEEFEKVSNLWSYAGWRPDQKRERGKQLDYDPEAKTLSWLVADRIIMQGENSRYKTEFYDPYKADQIKRMEESECPHCGKSAEDHATEACGEYKRHVLTQAIERYVDNADVSDDLNELVESDRLQAMSIQHIENLMEETIEISVPEYDFGLDVFDLPETYPDDATPPSTRGHAHNRAKRYLAKKFLKHYWAIARDIKGLETPDEWVLTHGGHEKETETFENPFYAKRELRSPT